MSDYMIKAIDGAGAFRLFIARTTDTAEEIRVTHKASPTAAAALGRLATITAILGADRKNEGESVTINFKGDGPGGSLVAVSDVPGEVRCSAEHPQADVPDRADGHFDVGAYVGKGALSIVRGIPGMEPFVGITEIVTGEIAEDIASYFFYSEQKPTVVMLGVSVGAAGRKTEDEPYRVLASGGVFIQALPGASEEDIDRMEKAVSGLVPVTEMIGAGLSPEDILNQYFGELNPEVLETLPVRYHCPCNRERVSRILASLPESDRKEIAEEDGGCEVVCEFCNTAYHFTAEEVLEPLKHLRTGEES